MFSYHSYGEMLAIIVSGLYLIVKFSNNSDTATCEEFVKKIHFALMSAKYEAPARRH